MWICVPRNPVHRPTNKTQRNSIHILQRFLYKATSLVPLVSHFCTFVVDIPPCNRFTTVNSCSAKGTPLSIKAEGLHTCNYILSSESNIYVSRSVSQSVGKSCYEPSLFGCWLWARPVGAKYLVISPGILLCCVHHSWSRWIEFHGAQNIKVPVDVAKLECCIIRAKYDDVSSTSCLSIYPIWTRISGKKFETYNRKFPNKLLCICFRAISSLDTLTLCST